MEFWPSLHLEEGVDEPSACPGHAGQALGLLGEQREHLVGIRQAALELSELQEALASAQKTGDLLVLLGPRSRALTTLAGIGRYQLVIERHGTGPTATTHHVVGLHLLLGGHRLLAGSWGLLRSVTHACVASSGPCLDRSSNF